MIHLSNIASLKVVAVVPEESTGLTQLFAGDGVLSAESASRLLAHVLYLCKKELLQALSGVNQFTRFNVINFLNLKFEGTGLLKTIEGNSQGSYPGLRVLNSLPPQVPLLYKSYAKITKVLSDGNFRITDVNQFQGFLKTIVKMDCHTSKDINAVLRVLEKFPNNQEDILTSLEYCEPGLRRHILDYFSQMPVPEAGEDGRYSLDIGGVTYKIGVEGPELEQKIGIFKEDRFLSGKKHFIASDANFFARFHEGEFYQNGRLRKGRIEFKPNAANSFRKSEQGAFYQNGNGLSKGKKEYEPNAANFFARFHEGEFYVNGRLRKGRIEFKPNAANSFRKSDEGEFYENARLKKGRIEFKPNIVNRFRKSEQGVFYQNGTGVSKGKKEYEPNAANRFRKSEDGTFYERRRGLPGLRGLSKGKREFKPNSANEYIKSEQGEFYEGRHGLSIVSKGKREYEPKSANEYIKSREGKFYKNGRLRNGLSMYYKRTWDYLGVKTWTSWYGQPIPGRWKLLLPKFVYDSSLQTDVAYHLGVRITEV